MLLSGTRTLNNIESALKTFPRKSLLLRHESTHKGITEKYILPNDSQCPHCDKVFSQKAFLKRHISAVHEKIRKFQCNLCDSPFTDATPLRIHLKRQKADPNNKQKCNFYKKMFFCFSNFKLKFLLFAFLLWTIVGFVW